MRDVNPLKMPQWLAKSCVYFISAAREVNYRYKIAWMLSQGLDLDLYAFEFVLAHPISAIEFHIEVSFCSPLNFEKWTYPLLPRPCSFGKWNFLNWMSIIHFNDHKPIIYKRNWCNLFTKCENWWLYVQKT